MRKFCSYFAVFLSIAVLLCGGTVSHAEEVHTLRVKFITESGPVTNSTLKLYPALTNDGVLFGDFAELSVDVGDLTDSENVNRLAYTLASYAASGVGEPIDSDVTNGLGYVDFENVPAGIYLVTGSSGTIGDLVYTPNPALISITNDSEELIEARLKYIAVASGTAHSYSIQKVWANQMGASHPQSVTVELFRNGELYDEVTLSAENGWSHKWVSLSSDYDWNVIEKDIPANYDVSITLDSNRFVIENKSVSTGVTITTTTVTATTEASTIETTGTGINPNSTAPKSTNTTTHTTSAKTPSGGSTNSPKLPQTGQLWYPVPILFAAGALLFFVGFISDRLSDDDEKE